MMPSLYIDNHGDRMSLLDDSTTLDLIFQLLESYRSLTLKYMANAFGVTEEYMDSELCRFIASGRLHAKIDKVGIAACGKLSYLVKLKVCCNENSITYTKLSVEKKQLLD